MKKIIFILAIIAAFFVVGRACFAVIPFETLLIKRIEDEAGINIEEGKSSTIAPGVYEAKDLAVFISESFIVRAGNAVVRCPVLEVLKKGLKLPLEVDLKDVTFTFKEKMLDAIGVNELHCDFIRSNLTINPDGKVEIDYFVASGKDGNLYLSGYVDEDRDMDLKLHGLLSRTVLERLPEVISMNLFYEDDEPLKEITLSLQGDPKSPSVNFETDLVKFTVRDNAQAS